MARLRQRLAKLEEHVGAVRLRAEYVAYGRALMAWWNGTGPPPPDPPGYRPRAEREAETTAYVERMLAEYDRLATEVNAAAAGGESHG